ncbi:non-ribosomal peptide synthetase [Mesorhizobium sp. B2-3-4]|uniref:non-ribosomal peptide synthetase n=1 Tax=Mesorhizobium sp. B2-3-4 TaxID=2589959 RepID=UPI00112C7B7B|nr:non-ribosomal peptide synthetase [Mesorhizobium sp. B2-3-4]TPM36094.1 amino acid adenylation domain-containing protein [Mesorhizobium sp. B2-3-4]
MQNVHGPAAGNGNREFLLEGIQQAYWVGQSGAIELSTPARYYVEADIPGHLGDGLTQALRRLVERHEMLRAVIHPSGNQEILREVGPYEITVEDLRSLREAERAWRVDTLRTEMRAAEIPSGAWPQFDIRATRNDEGIRLHLRFALWMMDGWSFHILLRELLALSADPTAELPEIAMSFADYVKAQGDARQSPRWHRAWDYWQPRLADFPGPPALPLSRGLGEGQKPRFGHLARTLGPAQWRRIVDICARMRTTPSLLACAVYTEVLSRYAGSQHFAITVLHSGRFQHLPRAANVFGNFGTTILVEVDASRTGSFLDRVKALQRQFWRDSERIEVSGIDVSRAIQQRAGTGPGIGIPVTFTAVTPADMSGRQDPMHARIDPTSARLEVPQVHLDHQMHLGEDGSAVFNWDYVEQIFPAGFVEELCQTHFDLMSRLAADEQLWHRKDPSGVREAPATAAIPAGELQRLEATFDRQAVGHPDRVAVIAGERVMTYGELRRRALAVAHELARRGVRRGELVAVSMMKGWEQVAAVLGILYAGAAYVPIDPELPEERRNLLFSGSGAAIVLTQRALNASLAWPARIAGISVDGLGEATSDMTVGEPGTTADLAYVIFTSGSTGTPKGVMIDHRGAANTIADLNARFTVGPEDKVLALSSLSFDLSVYDIFGMLAVGATIVMPDAGRAKEASHWRELTRRHGVTIWNSVPALMQLAVEGTHGAIMPSLRLVMLSGDWIPLNLPERIRPAAPAALLYSLGGATEASIWSILYPIGEIDREWRSIPYGHAMDHQSIHVLDADLMVCPPWVPGDLYIGGIGVALGYWRDEAKTSASFITHPGTGERLYRTGDLGRYLGDGEIEFLGRKDFQVKIQGYRVECAEVEAALLAGPEIEATVVSAAADSAGTRHLVAYVVAKPDRKELDIAALRERLRTTLPAYMVPAFFVTLDRLPLSDNGKVVRAALPKPEFGIRETRERSYAPPRGGLEETIARLWREVLATDDIGREDNFFALGGSSFAGMRLMAKLEERFGRRMPFAMLVSHPTLAAMADVVRGDVETHDASLAMRIRAGDETAPLFCVHPVGGNVMCYTALAQALPPGRAMHGIRAPGLVSDTETPLDSIAAMAMRYIEEIRSIQPNGPYHLLGWSLGGLVVQEMACRLAAEGETLGLVAMIDSAVPKPRGPATDQKPTDRFRQFAADLAAIANLSLDPSDKAMEHLTEGERFAGLARRMEEAGAPADITALRLVYNVFQAGWSALDRHMPRNADARLLLFAAANRADAGCMKEAWRKIIPGIEIVDMEADHYTIVRAPTINTIATRIAGVMAAADASDGPTAGAGGLAVTAAFPGDHPQQLD